MRIVYFDHIVDFVDTVDIVQVVEMFEMVENVENVQFIWINNQMDVIIPKKTLTYNFWCKSFPIKQDEYETAPCPVINRPGVDWAGLVINSLTDSVSHFLQIFIIS